MKAVEQKITAADWPAIREAMHQNGHAIIPACFLMSNVNC